MRGEQTAFETGRARGGGGGGLGLQPQTMCNVLCSLVSAPFMKLLREDDRVLRSLSSVDTSTALEGTVFRRTPDCDCISHSKILTIGARH